MAARDRKADEKAKEEAAIERQKVHERFTLILFGLGSVAIVAGMVVIAQFLSKGESRGLTLYIAGGMFAVVAVGTAVVWFMRRRADRAA